MFKISHAGIVQTHLLESVSDFRNIIGENFSNRQTLRTKLGKFFLSEKLESAILEKKLRALWNILARSLRNSGKITS